MHKKASNVKKAAKALKQSTSAYKPHAADDMLRRGMSSSQTGYFSHKDNQKAVKSMKFGRFFIAHSKD